jgi:pimeloyl-ACP methyl ester carboxylesterase
LEGAARAGAIRRSGVASSRPLCSSLVAETHDDDLTTFEAHGAPQLPAAERQGHVENDGARIWYSCHGSGSPVVLLHGGLGHGGNWGHQVPTLVAAGYQVVVIDSRGHGRSTRDERPYSYELMGSDVLAVLDELAIPRAALVGWSDGACTALILARTAKQRVAGVFFFACNMDPTGTHEFVMTPVIERCFRRHVADYARLSAAPGAFDEFVGAITLMQRTQPNYSTADLAEISVPVTIGQSQHDEFIRREHAEYLARTIPNATLVLLPNVSHFAPLQRPAEFNRAVLEFLATVWRG